LLALQASQASQAKQANQADVLQKFHFTADGGQLISASSINPDGKSLTVDLQGTSSLLPHRSNLTIAVDTDNKKINATLHLEEPVPLDLNWTFSMAGVIRNQSREIIGMSNLELDPETSTAGLSAQGVGTLGISWWCVLRCGGLSILGVLLRCVPAFFAGGPAGFVACVVGQAGGAAAGIAVCVARRCLS